ncbi:MAG: PAS domain S-box protein [Firmicutes bacterium]|nr:PAS domain S-box protein [Bacillota bacterium]
MSDSHDPRIEAGLIRFDELFDYDELTKLMDSFFAATGVFTGIFTPRTAEMLNSSSQAPLCSMHRLSRSAGRICARDVQLLVEAVALSGACQTRTCPHGLIHSACPLIIEGQVIAVLLVGQVLFTDPDMVRFRLQAADFQIDEAEYLRAASALKVIPEDQFQQVVDFISQCITLLANDSLRHEHHLILERQLSAEQARLEAIFKGSGDGMRIIGNDFIILDQNQQMDRLSGVPKSRSVGEKCFRSFHHAFCGTDDCIMGRILSGEESISLELTKRRPDGGHVEVSLIATPLRNESGEIIGIIESYRDISDMKTLQQELLEQKLHFEALFQSSADAIASLDRQHRVIDINPQFTKLFGYTLDELKGRNIDDFIIPEVCVDEGRDLTRRVLLGQSVEREAPRLTKDGSTILVSIRGGPLQVNDEVVGVYTLYTDITERKRAEYRLQYLSTFDALTELYNRAHFEAEMTKLDLIRSGPVTIITCDIDGLKIVNDTWGHEAGDQFLKEAAEVLRRSFRTSDQVARVGGDEFGVILKDTNRQAAEKVFERIREEIAVFNQATPKIPLSISVGMATTDDPEMSTRDLFKEADNNMYRQKLLSNSSARSAIVQALMTALEARDFITEGHADRMHHLAVRLGQNLGLSDRSLADLHLLARFHDIGKVGIPDRILFKAGPLTPDERAEMQRHCEIGHRIAFTAPDLVPIAGLILKHHEWWNGKGYPLGLNGHDIPLECRLLAIVDAYDAMTNDRPYRKAMAHDEALTELHRCAGIQFDPDLTAAFIKQVTENGRSNLDG